MRVVRLAGWSLTILFLAAGAAALAQAPALQTIRLICLPGTPLPVAIAQNNGIFAKYGIAVESSRAKDADDLRAKLAGGQADIAESAVENAVAAADGSGTQVLIVMGGEASTSELIVQPGIKSVKDLKGKTIITDGTDTAYTQAIKKILTVNGLKPDTDCVFKVVGLAPQRLQAMVDNKEYAAMVQKPPTSILAKRAGLVSLGTTQDLMNMPESQGIGAFVEGQWASSHADLLTRYIAAFLEGERWLTAPENRAAAIELVGKDAKVGPDIATETYEIDMMNGWEKDARFNPKGFENGLRLEAEVQGSWEGKAPAAQKYYDLSYYQKALAMLKK